MWIKLNECGIKECVTKECEINFWENTFNLQTKEHQRTSNCAALNDIVVV